MKVHFEIYPSLASGFRQYRRLTGQELDKCITVKEEFTMPAWLNTKPLQHIEPPSTAWPSSSSSFSISFSSSFAVIIIIIIISFFLGLTLADAGGIRKAIYEHDETLFSLSWLCI